MSGWTERDVRYSIDWPLTIQETGQPDIQGRILDISMGGCSVSATHAYPVGSEIKFLLTVPDSVLEKILLANPVPVQVKVVWCREHFDVNHMGVEFRYLSPIIRRSFSDAFNKFSDAMVKPQKNPIKNPNP